MSTHVQAQMLKKTGGKPIVVTGIMHGGTMHTNHYLQTLGLQTRHEKWGPDGSVAYQFAHPTRRGEELPNQSHGHPLYRPIFLHRSRQTSHCHLYVHPDPEHHHILHVTRDPHATLQSLGRNQIGHIYAEYFESLAGAFPEEINAQDCVRLPLEEVRALFYIYWNLLCERMNPALRFKVEEINKAIPAHFEIDPLSEEKLRSLKRFSKRSWFRNYDFQWNRIRPETMEKLDQMAVRYGYEPVSTRVQACSELTK
jgi:hypothetical protein